jgi:hypothetical protein
MGTSTDNFFSAMLEIKTLDPASAELRLRDLHARAMAERRFEHARACLSDLSVCLAEFGKNHESLRIRIQLARERPSPYTFSVVTYALERCGWLTWASHFFKLAFSMTERADVPVQWHEHARVGLDRIALRKTK